MRLISDSKFWFSVKNCRFWFVKYHHNVGVKWFLYASIFSEMLFLLKSVSTDTYISNKEIFNEVNAPVTVDYTRWNYFRDRNYRKPLKLNVISRMHIIRGLSLVILWCIEQKTLYWCVTRVEIQSTTFHIDLMWYILTITVQKIFSSC